MAQPVGGLIWHYYAKGLQNQLGQQTRVLVDVGQGTLDWVAVQGLKANFERSGSVQLGVGQFVDRIIEEMKGVKMKTGSDDQMKVYLNGKEVIKVTDARASDTDQDTTEVTLQKGENVLVAKVINEKVEWKFCVRFCDKADKPIKSLKTKVGE